MRTSGLIIIAAFLFLAGPGICAPTGNSVSDAALPDSTLMSAHILNLPYAGESNTQKLDIYLPKQGEKPYPVVLRIHGDTRKGVDKRSRIAAYANPLLKKGYAVVSIDYRYSSEAIYTARVYDAKAAVRYIKAEADTFELDPHRIIAWGDSTGGTLAALLAVSGDVKALEDLSLGNPDQSSRIYGAVVWFGVFDLLKVEDRDSKKGQLVKSVSELTAVLNPETYITVDDPPFLIQHGTDDTRVPVEQPIHFAGALENILGSEMVSLDLLDGAGHGGAVFFLPENMEKVITFLDTWTD